MSDVKKVVLAYSGGLDTSILVKWLREQYDCEVVAYTADVGQQEELDGLEDKAIRTGASKIYIEDLREEFARDFVFFAIKANAIYEGTYLLGTSIARPLIAKRQVEIALKENADAVCHGSTGKGNDQVRFEAHLLCPRASHKGARPMERMELLLTGRPYRLREESRHRRPREQGKALQHGQKPHAHQL